jgi:hypothetical protein
MGWWWWNVDFEEAGSAMATTFNAASIGGGFVWREDHF